MEIDTLAEAEILCKLYYSPYAKDRRGSMNEIANYLNKFGGYIQRLLTKFKEDGILVQEGKEYFINKDKILYVLKRSKIYKYLFFITNDQIEEWLWWNDLIDIGIYTEDEINDIKSELEIP